MAYKLLQPVPPILSQQFPYTPSDKSGMKRGPWSAEEDQKLVAYIKRYKIWNWMPKFAGTATYLIFYTLAYFKTPNVLNVFPFEGLSRNGKSSRLRWVNYLNPELKKGNITKEEEDTIFSMYMKLGSRWSAIAARLPGRTDNQIKNYWHTHLKKRFKEEKITIVRPEELKKRNIDISAVSSSVCNITPMVSSPETSTSEDSDKLSMMSTLLLGGSSSSTVGVLGNDMDNAIIESSKLNVDLDSFWTQPFSDENSYMVQEDEAYAAQELNPYGYSYES